MGGELPFSPKSIPSSLRRQGPRFLLSNLKKKLGPCLRRDDGSIFGDDRFDPT
jgi:hypothetical protein